MKNVGMFSSNTTGIKGVQRFKRIINGTTYLSWMAILRVNKKIVLKKYFQDKNEAIKARREAEVLYGIA